MYEFSFSTLPLSNPKSTCFQLQMYVYLLGYLFLYFLKFFTFPHFGYLQQTSKHVMCLCKFVKLRK